MSKGSGGGSTVIINALSAEANSPFNGALKYMHFQAGPSTFKAYGLSMGLLPQPLAILLQARP